MVSSGIFIAPGICPAAYSAGVLTSTKKKSSFFSCSMAVNSVESILLSLETLSLAQETNDVKTNVVLETGIEEIAVPYEWVYGFFALLLMGLAAIRRKK